MASFDVQSLLTNIPVGEKIDISVSRVFQHKKNQRNIEEAL